MNKKLYAGISQIVLGILIAIAPQTFAHVCAVKETPMACHYTAQAALGIGIVIVALVILGVVMTRPTYTTLIDCENAKSASQVKEILDADGTIDYKVSNSTHLR